MQQDVRRLVFVLGFGGFVGLLGVLLLAFFWGPSGRYHVNQVLLSPETIQKMEESGGRYHLDRIALERYEPEQNQRRTFSVSKGQYDQFFEKIRNDLSMKEGQSDHFMDPHITKLILYVNGEPFQELQMVRGDSLYRIQLHEDRKRIDWVYFERPGVERWSREVLNP